MANNTKRIITLFVTSFLIAQPFIDIFTSLATRAGMNLTLGVILRSLFMVALTLYVVFISKYEKKKYSVIYLVSVSVYAFIFLLYHYLQGGMSVALGNMPELVKTFYFSYVLVGFYALYKDYKYVVTDKVLSVITTAYMTVIFVAFITGTSFKAYTYGQGFVGWFYAANEIGAIIAILGPITIYYFIGKLKPALSERKVPFIILYAIPLLFVAFCSVFIGTKAVFLAIFAYIILSLLMYAVSVGKTIPKKETFNAIVTGIMCMFIAVTFVISPLRANISGNKIIDWNKQVLTEPSTDTTTEPSTEPSTKPSKDPSSGDEESESDQSALYVFVNKILSNRLVFAQSVDEAFNEAGIIPKLFGLGYVNHPGSEADITKTVEMDFFSVLYRHGFVGLLLYAVPVLAFFVYILIFAFKNFNKVFASWKFCAYLYSALVGLGISFVAGHVLVAPAVSIYFPILFTKLLESKAELSSEVSAQQENLNVPAL